MKLLSALLLMVPLAVAPSFAAGTRTPLADKAFHDIAASGGTYEIQNTGSAAINLIASPAATPPNSISGSITLAPGERVCRAVIGNDLWAESDDPYGAVSVASGITCQDTNNAPFADYLALTADDTSGHNVPSGKAIEASCTSAGNISFKLPNGKSKVIPVQIGYQYFVWAAVGLNATGTTAFCAVSVDY